RAPRASAASPPPRSCRRSSRSSAATRSSRCCSMSGDGSAAPVVRVEHLVAGYRDVVILDDVSCEVRRGEVFLIVGGSGSGKTTLMRHMIGLLRPSAGRVIIDGEDITHADEEQL